MTDKYEYIYFIRLSIISVIDLWLDKSLYTISKKKKIINSSEKNLHTG